MTLFDDRDSLGPARYAESHFAYLDRSARRSSVAVRELMESWYAQYPSHAQRQLRSRIRQRDDQQFTAAFFELYCHALLEYFGYHVTVLDAQGDSRSKTPDFLVVAASGQEFLLEATLASDVPKERAARLKLIDQAYDALNRVHSPDFFLRVDVHGEAQSPIPGKRLRARTEEFLATLNWNDLSDGRPLEKMPSFDFPHDGCTFTVAPIPKSAKSRGNADIRPLGMHGPGEGAWIDDRAPVKRAIEKKAGKYGELDRPFIVAVNALSSTIDRIDVMEALFGRERFVFHREMAPGDEPQMVRDRDGAWIGPSGAKNTRVSAVLLGNCIQPWTVAAHVPVVYHNPWAKKPCTEQLRELPSALPVGDQMPVQAGTAESPPFNLPERWPIGLD